MKFTCVVNPVSGRGKGKIRSAALSQKLRERGHAVQVIETIPDPERFRQRCRTIDRETRVICIGGDGTLLFFLNHCDRFHGVAFYGMGTANVITTEFGVPRDLDDFVAMLEADNRLEIRPGRTNNGDLFLMMYSYGIDGFVLSHASQRLKNLIGKSAFAIPLIKAMLRYRYPVCRLTLDEGETLSGTFAIVSRIRHYGGQFKVAPDADPRSGKFQVIVFSGRGFFRTARFAFCLLRGKTAPNSHVAVAEKVAIQCESPLFQQLDGDPHPVPVTELTVSPDHFPLIAPLAPNQA